MQQSPQKIVTKRRDRQVEFDVVEQAAERRLYRAALPKARKFPLHEEVQRSERSARHGPAR